MPASVNAQALGSGAAVGVNERIRLLAEDELWFHCALFFCDSRSCCVSIIE
jgi:hypothetical protein